MNSDSAPLLVGSFVQLEPLSLDHVHQLVVAANENRTTFSWTPVPDAVSTMRSYVANLIADSDTGGVMPFVQRRLTDQRVVGCTRYLEIRRWSGAEHPDEVEVGGTWLALSAQRTAVNTEAKYLLFEHAFETWRVQRLAICTDARNIQSRAAIERIGGSFEGILRNHRASAAKGEVGLARQTAAYSILPDEWPAIKVILRGRLYGDEL